MKKKSIERICGNCKLYDPGQCHCAVVIIADELMERELGIQNGTRWHMPVDSKDKCVYEEKYFNPTTKATEDFNEIKEVKFWVENERGQKTDGRGTVKIQYPDGFFGPGRTLKSMFGVAGDFVWELFKPPEKKD